MTILTKNQKFQKIKIKGKRKLVVSIRHDDSCGNGHNTFAITATLYEKLHSSLWTDVAGGQLIDEVKKFFPELEPYLKWHLCSTDGPMHYLADTLYHTEDKDCWGLRKGEKRQLKNGKTGVPAWKLTYVNKAGEEVSRLDIVEYPDSETQPPCEYTLEYRPWYRVGEGKESDLEAARSTAIWPEATLEQLQNKEALVARLPKLMEEFQAAVESLGLVY